LVRELTRPKQKANQMKTTNQISKADFRRLVALVNDGHNVGILLAELTGYENAIHFQSELNRIYAASDFADSNLTPLPVA
jgi:hypothetical protein